VIRHRSRKWALAAILPALLVPGAAQAIRTRTWTETPGELRRGQAEGVAVTSQGLLFLAPRLSRIGTEFRAGGAAHVWAATTDARGNVFLGTGPEGRIVKIAPSGAASVLFTAPEPMVTALLALPDGVLLAATAPAGKIYRVRADGSGEVWSETGERYVWSLARAADGTLFAGTGDNGLVLQIGASGKGEPLFDSDESHIRTLALLPDGELVAGGAGRGLLYRIGRKGSGKVIYDGAMPEVVSAVIGPDGSVFAGLISSPEPEPRPPALRIQVPQTAPVGSNPDNVGEIDDRGRATIEGVIEGLESAAESRGRGTRGRVVRVAPDGSSTEIWRSESEAPLSLAVGADGHVVFGTGEPGRIYRVESGGGVVLMATLVEAQVTTLLQSGSLLIAGTSNPAAAFRVERSPADTGLFVSRPFDAQAPARWGTARWRVEGNGAPGGVEIQARSGNSALPDSTWSSWGAEVTNASGGPLRVPDGRYLQWRARLRGSAGENARIGDVTVSFATENRPPQLESFRSEPAEAAVSGPLKFRYAWSDPDGDPVSVEIQYRRENGGEWKTAVRTDPSGAEADGSENRDAWRDGKATWTTAEVPEGAYEVRAVASDHAANFRGEGKEFVTEPSLYVAIDRTGPEVEARRRPDGSLDVVVTDSLSSLSRLEVVEGERVLFTVRADDGVCDARRETFRLGPADVADAASRRLRAVDAAGNATIREVPPR